MIEPNNGEENWVRCNRDGNIAYLTLNRPATLNAMNVEMLRQAGARLEELKLDGTVQGVIITGEGETAFSAGADIVYLHAASAMQVREYAQLAVAVNHRIETLGKPVVAAMNGLALGGGLEMAEACMLRVAVPEAKMGHPEVRIGAVAGFGGTTRLPRLIGKGRAAELLLTGGLVGAQEALRIGLIGRIAPRERLLCDSERLLREILSHSQVAVRLTWEAIHRGLNLPLEESALLGADYFGIVAGTKEFRDRTGAFLDKTLFLKSN